MTEQDRIRWDARYEAAGADLLDTVDPPATFAASEAHFPVSGTALDVACGGGAGSVWLARRGLTVWGIDISPVAIAGANALADHHEVEDHCRFEVVDLDKGLPPGPLVDVILCHLFRGQNLVGPMLQRLAPEGVLAVAVLSEVGAEPGDFRAPAGELLAAFGHLNVLEHGEQDGRAWIVAQSPAR